MHNATQDFEVTNVDLNDPAMREPLLRPAEVYARGGELDDCRLDDTMETPIEQVHRALAHPMLPLHQVPSEHDDRFLIAIGLGVVSSMMALLLVLASGYGAA